MKNIVQLFMLVFSSLAQHVLIIPFTRRPKKDFYKL